MPGAQRVHVVPHTHWDREWYLTFEEFRERLVETLDRVLELVENGSYPHFHLDGQTAMIDDYLSVRPENEARIRSLVERDALSCGPWVTLVDEFLVSGESIIRNLEAGMKRASELGGTTMIGYLPDQFGHIGQMPQILKRAGFERAVTWRGVPAAITRSGFMWAAPDGSEIEVTYLPCGYSNAKRLWKYPEIVAERLGIIRDRLAPFTNEDEPLLFMAGDDHELPDPRLPEMLRGQEVPPLQLELSSLAAYLDDRPKPEQRWTGELRSAARANLLPNTYSVRAPQKIARMTAELGLERYAEPLTALVPGIEWPQAELERAWGLLHLNGAHDSVCGCSTDAVARAVDARTREAREIAADLTIDALQALVDRVSREEWSVTYFNPSLFERDGVPPLGWATFPVTPHVTRQVPLEVEDNRVVARVDGTGLGVTKIGLQIQDQPDVGDLYNFSAGGPATVHVGVLRDDEVRIEADTFSASVLAQKGADDNFVSFSIAIDNRVPDHRLRVLLDLPQSATSTVAASPFEFVERPPRGEGGTSEPPSPDWPARGIVLAGGTGFLGRGVFEYELVDGRCLALTLLRCTSTISRKTLPNRSVTAGPDVPTPEAQLIGHHAFSFGVLLADSVPEALESWERFALPLAGIGAGFNSGPLPSRGSLLEVDAPALSAVRRRGRDLEVRVWNPGGEERPCSVAGRSFTLGGHSIETITLPAE